jgi:hypothetical protein
MAATRFVPAKSTKGCIARLQADFGEPLSP